MTRSFDTISSESDSQAPLPDAPATMQVCPFCGAIAEKANGPCPRCKMENTALTRQATRARIGTWYVMQARNPSAPGMKYATLLALIRKGQVTGRSVVRGPTTHQLWRFAARVKGISREFGVCYSCGADLARTAATCPRCARSQDLPQDPDVFLENEIQAGKTVYREVKPADSTPAAAAAVGSRVVTPVSSSVLPPSARAAAPAASEPPIPSRPSTPAHPTAAATMAGLADLPSPESAPPELRSRARQRPQEGVLSARELAAAFSLQYDPKMELRVGRRKTQGRKIWIAAACLLVGGAALAGYYDQAVHQLIASWVTGIVPSSPSHAHETPQTPSDTVTFDRSLEGTPVNPPITGKPAIPPVDNSEDSLDGGASASVAARPQQPIASQPPTVRQPPPVAPPTVAQAPVPQQSAPKPVAPAVQPPAAVVAQPAAPLPAPPVHPAPTPAPVANATANSDSLSVAAAKAAKLKQNAIDDDTFALELRANGMEAEARHDYQGAEFYYKAVEQLSRDHWPYDIDQRLKAVEKELNSQ